MCHATKYQIWSLQMTTQWRACNAGPQKAKHKTQIITKYKLAQSPLIPMGIYKKVLHNLQYPDGCNVDQGSFIHTTSHTHKPKLCCEQDMSPPITLTRPWSIIQLLRLKPILPNVLQKVQTNNWFCGQWLTEVSVLQTTHSGTMMVLCTGKQKAYAKCTTFPTKYNTTCILTP